MAVVLLALGLIVCLARINEAVPMGTAWTYQGRLMDANIPADGLYDFQFKLFDVNEGGVQKGPMIDFNDVDVIDGYFTVELDFGSSVFDGNAVWLETTVSQADGSDPCTLSPRVEITPVPYALQARGIFVDNNGNVGIGTTNPGPKLHVVGDGMILESPNFINNTPFLVFNAGGGFFGQIRAKAGNKLFIQGGSKLGLSGSSSSDDLYIDTNGNVGLGTTSPQSHVQIDNSLDATGSGASNLALLVRRNSILTGSGPGIGFCSDNSLAVGAKIVHVRTSSNSMGDLAFYTKSATSGPSTEKMRIKDNGNIGIGTTSPVDKLHIQTGNLQGLTIEGSGGNVFLRLKENSAGGKNYLLGSSGGASGLGQGVFTIRDFTTDVVRLRIESNGDTALGGSFGASASSSISGAHIVTKGGNVGIGTTSPQSHVQIDNSLNATVSGASNLALLVRRNSILTGSGPGIGFCSDNSLAVGAKIVHVRTSSNSKGDLAFYTKSATSGPTTEKMRIKDTGNIGIGTTSPVDKLHIQTGNLQGLTIEGSGGNVFLRLKENSAGGKNYLLGSSGGASGLGQGVFTIRDFTTDVVRLRIESNGDTALGGSFGASASSSISGAHIVTKGGNVGIGTTSPQSHVQIDNSLNATVSGASNLALLVRRNSILTGSGPGIGFCSDNSLAVGAKIVHVRTSSNSMGDLAFYTKSATSGPTTEKMRIKDSGNVGIGTTVPIVKLHVEGGLRVTADGDFLGSFLRTSGNLIANGEIYKQGADPVYINDDLDVNGKIYQRGTQIHADYVFEPDYKLESIEEHSEFMWQNKHLKAIPKAEVDENGREIIEVGAHRKGIVEELEKAHIYIEQLHKQNNELETRLLKLEALVAQLNVSQQGGIK